MKKLLILLAFGLLTHILWTISAFIAYSLTGGEDGKPNLLGSLIGAMLVLPMSFGLGRRYARNKEANGLIYAVTTTATTFLLNLVISIPNGTSQSFFGSWFVYITFIAVFVGGYLGLSRKFTAPRNEVQSH